MKKINEDEKVNNLEEEIKELGYAFRDLTYHTEDNDGQGKYSCRLGYSFLKGIKGKWEFWGKTPLEAVLKAKQALSEIYKDE